MRSSVRSLALAACLASLATVTACGDGSKGSTGSPGTLRVLLTDAPFPYDSIQSVELYVESVAAATSADTTNPAGMQWITIAEPERRYDLLELQKGTTAILGEGELPAGQYRAVRLVLNTAESRVIDKRGRLVDVQWQGTQGRVSLHALVEDAVDAAAGGSIVIDLDVGRSFLCPGDACGGTLLFIPWFRAVNTAATGSLAGAVRDGAAAPVPNATVSVLGSNGVYGTDYVVATGATDAQGKYRVSFLRPGRYKVHVDAPRGANLAAGRRSAVDVTAGSETASIDFELAEASNEATVLLSSDGPATIQVGDRLNFTAYVLKSGPDSATQNYAVTWSSSTPDVMSVEGAPAQKAVAIGLAPGTASITASVAGVGTGSTLVTVVPRRIVEEVALNIPRAKVAVGDSVIAVASGNDASGQPVVGATFTFTVSDPSVVEARGVYSGMFFVGTAKKAGTATITATSSNGKTASGTVTVQ